MDKREKPPEVKWQQLKEGEISPYKVLVALFIREVYTTPLTETRVKLHPYQVGDERLVSPNALLLIYKLITSHDLCTCDELKHLIEDPVHRVRPEVLKRFFRTTSNLDPSNSYFLYELAYSIVTMESSQIIILKKKIGKNSPFGKFLRGIYLNIRKMSYAQAHFMFQQLTTFLKVSVSSNTTNTTNTAIATPISGKRENLRQIASTSGSGSNSVEKKEKEKSHRTFRGLDLFQKLTEQRKGPNSIGADLFSSYIQEYRKCTGSLTEKDQKAFALQLEQKKSRSELANEKVISLRQLWTQPLQTTEGSKPTTPGLGDSSSTSSGSPSVITRANAKRRSTSLRRTYFASPRPASASSPSAVLRSPRTTRASTATPTKPTQTGEILMVDESDENYFLPEDPIDRIDMTEKVMTSTPNPKSPRGKRKLDNLPLHTISAIPKVGSSVNGESQEEVQNIQKEKGRLALVLKEKELICSRWDLVKHWSRKQIERAVKNLISRMYSANTGLPSPQEVSQFVHSVLKNPSAQLLFPQLHFVEYLNGLRIKDLTRCSDSLRTSFDLKIKPNTTELNKGTTYAAYNFALFYNQLGYREDAMSSLEEAFRAGHAAGDATCLHHCHNLWSSFHSRAYTDAIVTVVKEVDNNMAYLHSQNVIINAFDIHYGGVPPEEVLFTLWHYNADCDLEEMEAMLLSSLASFFNIFGWHEMASFPCQIILYCPWKWGTRWYAQALCTLCLTLLHNGDIEVPSEIMDYGHSLFGLDGSPAGQAFVYQHALFKALKEFLGFRAILPEIIATIMAFDTLEGAYWTGYNLIIRCDWQLGAKVLKKLGMDLKDVEKRRVNFELNDLQIRCLLLQAQLECLCGNAAGALNYLSEALELATSIYSDFYITLCLANIASIQCELNLVKAGVTTLEKDLRCEIRASSPWLKARVNVVKAKLMMRAEGQVTMKGKGQELMDKLDMAEGMYTKWGNKYRLKEILYLKAELLDRSTDLQQIGSVPRKKLASINSHLPWLPSTCLI